MIPFICGTPPRHIISLRKVGLRTLLCKLGLRNSEGIRGRKCAADLQAPSSFMLSTNSVIDHPLPGPPRAAVGHFKVPLSDSDGAKDAAVRQAQEMTRADLARGRENDEREGESLSLFPISERPLETPFVSSFQSSSLRLAIVLRSTSDYKDG